MIRSQQSKKVNTAFESWDRRHPPITNAETLAEVWNLEPEPQTPNPFPFSVQAAVYESRAVVSADWSAEPADQSLAQ